MDKPTREKIHCNACRGPRWHEIKTEFEFEGYEELTEEYGEPWYDHFEICQCEGCDSILVRREFTYSLFGIDREVTYFPPRISRHLPPWSSKLPPNLRMLLREVYQALQADSPRLALMGIRAVVDLAIVARVGDQGTFREKLEALEESGVVGHEQKEFLSAVLNAGSAATHRGHAPDRKQLSHAMDIVENMLQAAYILKEAADQLREATPPRKRRPRRNRDGA